MNGSVVSSGSVGQKSKLTASNLNAHNEQIAEDEKMQSRTKKTSSIMSPGSVAPSSNSNSSNNSRNRTTSVMSNTNRHIYHPIPLELSSRNLLYYLYNTQNEEEKELMQQRFIDSKYIVAIGDLHGHLSALKLLMLKLEEALGNDLHQKYHLVFLGDYVDRGPKIKETIEYLIQLEKSRKPGTTHFLMGNHDFAMAMFLGLFDDQVKEGESLGSTCKGYFKNYELWKGNGSEHMHLQGRRWGPGFTYSSFNTFYSYCTKDGRKDNDVIGDRDLLLRRMPESHKQFFRNTPWMLYNEKNIFVHGGFQTSSSLKEQMLPLMRRDIMVPRIKPISERNFSSMDGHEDSTRRIVSGHMQVDRVKVSPKRALVDVSGGLTGELACVVLPSCKVITTQPPVAAHEEEEEFDRLLNSD